MIDTMCNEVILNNENKVKEYVNIQTGEKLDWNKVELLPDNAMLKVRPELWIEWDFEKNGELGEDVWELTYGSSKKVWWICGRCLSNFSNNAKGRVRCVGCPYCKGSRVNHTNSLASLNPNLAAEWHPTKNGELTPHDVRAGSTQKAWWLCPKCNSSYNSAIGGRNDGRKCPYCTSQKVNHTNSLAVLRPEIAQYWHPNKNKKTPYEVSVGSNQMIWWLGECGHEWENTVKASSNNNGRCPYCSGARVLKGFNDLWTTHHNVAKLLVDSEIGYIYSYGSKAIFDWLCECGNIVKNKSIATVVFDGLVCSFCSDGFSYPEKFMSNLLKVLDIDFVTHKRFGWSQNKEYDFYLKDYLMLIETHGIQHYEEGFQINGARTLAEEQANDKFKYEMAIANGIESENYIVIDCRYSELEWIKNNILNSKLAEIFDLSGIDWEYIDSISNSSTYLKTIELWNTGEYGSPRELAEKIGISDTTVRNYLYRGVRNKHCSYDPKDSFEKGYKKISNEVVQLDLEGNYIQTFRSIRRASEGINLKVRPKIAQCCRDERDSIGGYKWMYYEDYINMSEKNKTNKKDGN